VHPEAFIFSGAGATEKGQFVVQILVVFHICRAKTLKQVVFRFRNNFRLFLNKFQLFRIFLYFLSNPGQKQGQNRNRRAGANVGGSG